MAVYNNCLLAALNWSGYVRNPWTSKAQFDYPQFEKDVAIATAFLNAVSDVNENMHPLEEQRAADKYGKRIGLELTALADTVAMLGMEYGEDDAVKFAADTQRLALIKQLEMSLLLAKTLGPCAALQDQKAVDRFLDCPFIQNLGLDTELKDAIRDTGLRNTAFNTVGPTGSISILLNNCSSGVEPIFRFSYRRETRLTDRVFEFVHMPALLHARKHEELHGLTAQELKAKLNYISSDEVSNVGRLKMQAALQMYTDSAISSTVNLPKNATAEDISRIIMLAATSGLKGITIFRDGCKAGVLSSTASSEQQAKPAGVESMDLVFPTATIMELNDVETAERHRVAYLNSKMYVIVSLTETGAPIEVFVKLPVEAGMTENGAYSTQLYHEKFSLWETITRLVSLLLRAGVPLKEVLKQLDKGSFSMVDAAGILARILRKYDNLDQLTDFEGNPIGTECPTCHQMTYVHMGGCPTCTACGYTKCG